MSLGFFLSKMFQGHLPYVVFFIICMIPSLLTTLVYILPMKGNDVIYIRPFFFRLEVTKIN